MVTIVVTITTRDSVTRTGKQLGARIPPALYEELTALAEREQTTISRLVEQAIRDLLRRRGGK
jgi:predicted DNA-binding ribbon-helix-helix protein